MIVTVVGCRSVCHGRHCGRGNGVARSAGGDGHSWHGHGSDPLSERFSKTLNKALISNSP